MSKELDELAKQFQKEKPTVLKTDISIYKSSLSIEAANFLRSVEMQCKKQKQPNLVLVAIIPEVQNNRLI